MAALYVRLGNGHGTGVRMAIGSSEGTTFAGALQRLIDRMDQSQATLIRLEKRLAELEEAYVRAPPAQEQTGNATPWPWSPKSGVTLRVQDPIGVPTDEPAVYTVVRSMGLVELRWRESAVASLILGTFKWVQTSQKWVWFPWRHDAPPP